MMLLGARERRVRGAGVKHEAGDDSGLPDQASDSDARLPERKSAYFYMCLGEVSHSRTRSGMLSRKSERSSFIALENEGSLQ